MANLNRIQLIGNLTADPEVRQSPSGSSKCTVFCMAINRQIRNGNETQQETTFLDITCHGRTGEVAAQYLRKGRPVFVEGRVTQEKWTDKATGKQRSRLRIIGENLQFIDGNQQQGNQSRNSYDDCRF